MPTIPIVERKTQARPLPVGNTAPPLSAPRLSLPQAPDTTGLIANAMQNRTRAIQEVGNAFSDIATDAKRKGDQIEVISAQRKLDEWEKTNISNGLLNQRGKDVLGAPQRLEASYRQYAGEIWDSLANDDQRAAFEQIADSRQKSVYLTALRHEREQMDAYAKNETEAAVASAGNRAENNYRDPIAVENSISNAIGAFTGYARTQGLPDEAISVRNKEIERDIRKRVVGRMATENPEDFLSQVDRPSRSQGGFDGAMSIVRRNEGGFTPSDGASGAPAIFGINQKWHPDAYKEAKRLADSGDQAGAQAYADGFFKKEFWDKNSIDALPAPVQDVVFDGAVNHRTEFVRELIKSAKDGASRDQLIEMRRKEYQRLATEAPDKYADSARGWENRLQNLTLNGNGGTGIPSLDFLPYDDRQQIINSAYSAVSRRDAIYEKKLKLYQDQNAFDLYDQITNPKRNAPVSQDDVTKAVHDGRIDPGSGRTLINLLNSDESRDDDLETFAELSRREASGELTAKDVIDAHAAGNLKTSTARSMITGITTNISQNEAYRAGQDVIKAEFDRSDFGVTKGDQATREAEALRELQRRSSAGENPSQVSDEIVKRLRETSQSDRAYQRTLSSIRKDLGINTSNAKDIEQAADRIMEAAKRGTITKEEEAIKLNALHRKIQEIESGL